MEKRVRLQALRAVMFGQGVEAVSVPMFCSFSDQDLSFGDEGSDLAWLSGFSGSGERALVWQTVRSGRPMQLSPRHW
jgi:hypothetical protein